MVCNFSDYTCSIYNAYLFTTLAYGAEGLHFSAFISTGILRRWMRSDFIICRLCGIQMINSTIVFMFMRCNSEVFYYFGDGIFLYCLHRKIITVFPRIKAAATIILMCQRAAATIQGRPQFESGYYYTSEHVLVLKLILICKILHHSMCTLCTQPYMDMHASSLVQYTKSTVILKNDLVLKFTFIFTRGCKSIFSVVAAVIFNGKSASCFRNGWTRIVGQPTFLHDIMLFCMHWHQACHEKN